MIKIRGYLFVVLSVQLYSQDLITVLVDDPLCAKQRAKITVSQKDLECIAYAIWTNECGKGDQQKKDNLIHWSPHEEHPSVGIMHFTWSPTNDRQDRNQFLLLQRYIKKKSKKSLPKKFLGTCPWRTREDFLRQRGSKDMELLRSYLLETVSLQAEFLIKHRFKYVLKKMREHAKSNRFSHIREQFYRMIEVPGGLFALLDTLNLSGERALSIMLDQMEGTSVDRAALEQFVQLRIKRFHYLVEQNQKLSVHLQGWINRVNRYLEDLDC